MVLLFAIDHRVGQGSTGRRLAQAGFKIGVAVKFVQKPDYFLGCIQESLCHRLKVRPAEFYADHFFSRINAVE
jgi:hypothetical protein